MLGIKKKERKRERERRKKKIATFSHPGNINTTGIFLEGRLSLPLNLRGREEGRRRRRKKGG